MHAASPNKTRHHRRSDDAQQTPRTEFERHLGVLHTQHGVVEAVVTELVL